VISVVLPAFNEAATIGRTLEGVRRALDGTRLGPYEIIVVDDGSTDGTAELASAAGARIVRHPANSGYGRALKDGITAARYDTIVILDADDTYPTEAIPRLIAELERGYDLVVGARTGIHYRGGWFKAPLRALLTSLAEFTTGQRIADVNSGLRAFRRSTTLPYFPQLCDTFSFTTSMTLAYMLTGRFVQHMPIEYFDRVGTTKVHLFRDSLRTLQYIVQSIVYYNPVKLFLLLAGLCLACGLVAASLGNSLLGGLAVLTAIVVFGLGLVADLLRQILGK
jgi:glycosyltransferase involved in cell wall biosynthesis